MATPTAVPITVPADGCPSLIPTTAPKRIEKAMIAPPAREALLCCSIDAPWHDQAANASTASGANVGKSLVHQ